MSLTDTEDSSGLAAAAGLSSLFLPWSVSSTIFTAKCGASSAGGSSWIVASTTPAMHTSTGT
jgi:hypothetical protein